MTMAFSDTDIRAEVAEIFLDAQACVLEDAVASRSIAVANRRSAQAARMSRLREEKKLRDPEGLRAYEAARAKKYWARLKDDPERLAKRRAYKREWMRRKREQAKLTGARATE